ncbi:hypothetical protein DPMN_127035 [Dreissena polymorpha]|uniref:Uncharacterized protein n=1 Tax=Dreissena polymorpha TaxID=45954 RepID=A0A9D4GYF5_DREPO|nr:hypothetical protein DPMN_127035 [Dreissena polymorpha]
MLAKSIIQITLTLGSYLFNKLIMHCRKNGRLRPYLDPHQELVGSNRRKEPGSKVLLCAAGCAVMELSVSGFSVTTLDLTIDIVPLYIEYQYVMISDKIIVPWVQRVIST